jgi:hypothetical protein
MLTVYTLIHRGEYNVLMTREIHEILLSLYRNLFLVFFQSIKNREELDLSNSAQCVFSPFLPEDEKDSSFENQQILSL